MAVESTQPVKVQTPAAPAAKAPEAKKGEKAPKTEVAGKAAAVDVKAAPAAKAPEATIATATKAPGQGEKLDVKA